MGLPQWLLDAMVKPDHDDSLSEYSGEPFDEHENRYARFMIEGHKRSRWFWTVARTWTLWMGAVAVAITSMYGWLKDVVKALSH